MIFEQKYLSCYVLVIDQISLSGTLYFMRCWMLDNMRTAIVCKPGCNVMGFEVNLVFLIKAFFLHDQKFVTKAQIS